MIPVDPRTAALRDIADHLPGMRQEVKGLREDVQKDRRKIKWLIRACIVLSAAVLAAVGVLAYQQTVITALTDQNADRVAADARNAHDLCVKLTHSRAVIVGVWGEVQFRRGVNPSVQLAKVEAAEPLGRCPKATPAGS